MPGSLGGLVVSLGLNAAEFTTGLTKAERDAAKFAAAIDRGIAQAASAAGVAMAALGTAALAAAVAVDQFAKQAAQFQDLSEKTGASAESLASFAVAAQVSGTSMETVANISVKLSKALSGIDDETKAAGAAMKALGINVAQFQQLTPDQQVIALAKAFNQFADGSGKTAAALAILGKSGADALPFFKELAEGVGQVNILTAEQIKRADEYADAQARTRATLQQYAQALSTELLPAFNALTEASVELVKSLLGINAAGHALPTDDIRRFGEEGAVKLAFLVDAGQGLAAVFRTVGTAIGGAAAALEAFSGGRLREALNIARDIGRQIDAILNEKLFSTRVEDAIRRARESETARAVGPPAPVRAQVPFRGVEAASRAAAARTSEAERFLESLKRQLEATQQLTAEEKALAEIQSGRLKGLTPAVEAQILATAREIDQIKALEDARKAAQKAVEEDIRAAKELAREREQAARAAQASAARIEEANETLRDEIEIIRGGDAARQAVAQRRISNAIAAKQELLGIRELLGANADELRAINQEIEALQERAVLLQKRDLEEQLRRDAEALQQFKNMFADTFADAFASFIDGSKSAADAFKAFAKSVEQQITRLAAQKLGDAIFGGTSGSGFDLSKIFGSIFGAAGSSFTGAPFGTLATGTNYWRGGPTIVGEEGPEVVNLPRGSQVIPSEESQKIFGPRMNFVINVLPGASTRTAQQAAAMTGIAVQRAMVRNT